MFLNIYIYLQFFFIQKLYILQNIGRKQIYLNKNAFFLFLLFKEISHRPELSSPHRFRIQGGYPERDTGEVVVEVAGLYFPFLI